MISPETRTIVFFDGVCHLCNGIVDFSLARDVHRRLHFAPLQGDTAARLLPPADRENLQSLVVHTPRENLRESEAMAHILCTIGGPWKVLGLAMKLIPRPLKNAAYRAIARNRYRLLGKREQCRLPTKEERGQLLD